MKYMLAVKPPQNVMDISLSDVSEFGLVMQFMQKHATGTAILAAVYSEACSPDTIMYQFKSAEERAAFFTELEPIPKCFQVETYEQQ